MSPRIPSSFSYTTISLPKLEPIELSKMIDGRDDAFRGQKIRPWLRPTPNSLVAHDALRTRRAGGFLLECPTVPGTAKPVKSKLQ